MSDELLQYRHFVSKQQSDKDLTDEQEEEVLAQFASLDPERKGQIEWSDFLYFESLAVLRKLRTEVVSCNKEAKTFDGTAESSSDRCTWWAAVAMAKIWHQNKMISVGGNSLTEPSELRKAGVVTLLTEKSG